MDDHYADSGNSVLSELTSTHEEYYNMRTGYGPIRFNPTEDDYVTKSCCHCCSANLYVEYMASLKSDPAKFDILRTGFQDSPGGHDILCLSHDSIKNGKHPFPGYIIIFNNDPDNSYYKFILTKLLSIDSFKADFNKNAGNSEFSKFYFVVKYLNTNAKRNII